MTAGGPSFHIQFGHSTTNNTTINNNSMLGVGAAAAVCGIAMGAAATMSDSGLAGIARASLAPSGGTKRVEFSETGMRMYCAAPLDMTFSVSFDGAVAVRFCKGAVREVPPGAPHIILPVRGIASIRKKSAGLDESKPGAYIEVKSGPKDRIDAIALGKKWLCVVQVGSEVYLAVSPLVDQAMLASVRDNPLGKVYKYMYRIA